MPKHRIVIRANSPLPTRAEVEEIVRAGKGVLESYSIQPSGRRAQSIVDTTESGGRELAAMVARRRIGVHPAHGGGVPAAPARRRLELCPGHPQGSDRARVRAHRAQEGERSLAL